MRARAMLASGVAAIVRNSDGALPNAGSAGLSPKRPSPRAGLPNYGEPWELILGRGRRNAHQCYLRPEAQGSSRAQYARF